MTIKQLTSNIDDGLALKQITVAYTEIASGKLKNIRSLVEHNRYFLQDLAVVYQVVKQVAAVRQVLLPKNSKTVSILITSNYHFYGNVNAKLVTYFTRAMKKAATDQIIIGKTGLELLKDTSYNLPYQSLVLEKDYPNTTELQTIVSQTRNYSQIVVYYSEMKNVMTQNPMTKDITQTSFLKTSIDLEYALKTFIFEPEMEKILEFFDMQVTNLLLQQTFLDSELSRTASRLVSMDQAQSKADTFLASSKTLLDQAKRSLTNMRLLETASAMKMVNP